MTPSVTPRSPKMLVRLLLWSMQGIYYSQLPPNNNLHPHLSSYLPRTKSLHARKMVDDVIKKVQLEAADVENEEAF